MPTSNNVWKKAVAAYDWFSRAHFGLFGLGFAGVIGTGAATFASFALTLPAWTLVGLGVSTFLLTLGLLGYVSSWWRGRRPKPIQMDPTPRETSPTDTDEEDGPVYLELNLQEVSDRLRTANPAEGYSLVRPLRGKSIHYANQVGSFQRYPDRLEVEFGLNAMESAIVRATFRSKRDIARGASLAPGSRMAIEGQIEDFRLGGFAPATGLPTLFLDNCKWY